MARRQSGGSEGRRVYGRLDESKETGTFAGRSQLKLQLTGIVVNGQTVPLVPANTKSPVSPRERAPQKGLLGEPPSVPSSVRSQAEGRERPSGQERVRAWEPPRKLSRRGPGEDPERDSTGFHAATGRDNSETRSLIALAQKLVSRSGWNACPCFIEKMRVACSPLTLGSWWFRRKKTMQLVRIVSGVRLIGFVTACLLVCSAQFVEPGRNRIAPSRRTFRRGRSKGIFVSYGWTADKSRAGRPSGPGGAKSSAPKRRTC